MPVALTDGRITLEPAALQYLDALLEAALETRAELVRWMGWSEKAFERTGENLARHCGYPGPVALLARWASEALHLSHVVIKTDPENEASRRLAEKLGARFEGEQTHVHDDGSEHREAVCVLSQ